MMHRYVPDRPRRSGALLLLLAVSGCTVVLEADPDNRDAIVVDVGEPTYWIPDFPPLDASPDYAPSPPDGPHDDYPDHDAPFQDASPDAQYYDPDFDPHDYNVPPFQDASPDAQYYDPDFFL